MKTAWIGLVLAAGLAACSSSMEAAKPGTAARSGGPVGCSLGIPGASAAVEDSEQGVAFTFRVGPKRLDELRARAQQAAAMHGPGAKVGPGHDGAHGQGGHHGLQAMQLPPSRATTTDVEGGVRIDLVPVDASDRAPLAAKAREGVRRLNASDCN